MLPPLRTLPPPPTTPPQAGSSSSSPGAFQRVAADRGWGRPCASHPPLAASEAAALLGWGGGKRGGSLSITAGLRGNQAHLLPLCLFIGESDKPAVVTHSQALAYCHQAQRLLEPTARGGGWKHLEVSSGGQPIPWKSQHRGSLGWKWALRGEGQQLASPATEAAPGHRHTSSADQTHHHKHHTNHHAWKWLPE